MRTHRIHLINPKTNSLITRPIYLNRALYSPLAGLLAVAALIPQERYETVLTDENIEPIDFDLKVDLVGITAMTSYVKRAYEIADRFRERGIPVLMGGIHASFMPDEALDHADAVVVGEAELIMPKVLSDMEKGCLNGIYKAERLHSLEGMALPRYDLLKTNRYVNKTYVQTSRGCHHGCTFCTEHVMNGLKFRNRPIGEVTREIELCGERKITLNDADFFGCPARAKDMMRALKGMGVRWQAGVNSRAAGQDDLLDLAAESGCYMLSIGFESIFPKALRNVHKNQNHPERFEALIKKVQSYGIMVFGLFMFGFDSEEDSVFEQTTRFSIDAGLDVCAYSLLTPYPGTLQWFELLKQGRIVSFDWDKYDQGSLVVRVPNLSHEQIKEGYMKAYRQFYSIPSVLRRFPAIGSRSRFQWTMYNMFFRKGKVARLNPEDIVAEPTEPPLYRARPPIMPGRKDWAMLVNEGGPEFSVNRKWPAESTTVR